MSKIPDVHFVNEDKRNWRLRLADESDDDSDEELDKTPEDVVGMLGFDPKELKDEP